MVQIHGGGELPQQEYTVINTTGSQATLLDQPKQSPLVILLCINQTAGLYTYLSNTVSALMDSLAVQRLPKRVL